MLNRLNPPAGWPAPWRRHFYPMWAGQAVSLVGSRVVQFALVWWLTVETGSATVLATATLVALVPEILLGPIAGAYVDRWDRRLIMVLADGAVALASWALAFLFYLGVVEVWHIYVLLLVRAVLGSFQWPAFLATTSLMVPEKQLTRVAGLNQSLNGLLAIISPPLGALLLELLPFNGVMLVDVFTAVLAVIPLLFIFVPQPLGEEAATGGANSVWSDLRSGFRYVLNWRGLMVLIVVATVIKIALTPAFALLPLLVKEYFQGGAPQLSLIEAVSGVGILVGGIMLGVWGGFKRRIRTVIFGLILLAVSLLAVGLTPAGLFIMAIAAVFVTGFSIPLVDGPILAIFQATVAPEIQGRVFSLVASLGAIATPIGLIAAGPVSDLFSLQVWFIAAGVMGLLGAVALYAIPAAATIEDRSA